MHKKAVSDETAFFVPLPLPCGTNSRTNRPPRPKNGNPNPHSQNIFYPYPKNIFRPAAARQTKKQKKFLSPPIARYQPISDARQLFVPKNSL